MLSEGTRPLPRCSDLGGGPLSRTEVKGPSPRRLLYWEEVHISRGHTAYAQHCIIALDLHLLINDISCVDVHSRIERSKKKKVSIQPLRGPAKYRKSKRAANDGGGKADFVDFWCLKASVPV